MCAKGRPIKEAVESIYMIQNSVCAKDRPNTYICYIPLYMLKADPIGAVESIYI